MSKEPGKWVRGQPRPHEVVAMRRDAARPWMEPHMEHEQRVIADFIVSRSFVRQLLGSDVVVNIAVSPTGKGLHIFVEPIPER